MAGGRARGGNGGRARGGNGGRARGGNGGRERGGNGGRERGGNGGRGGAIVGDAGRGRGRGGDAGRGRGRGGDAGRGRGGDAGRGRDGDAGRGRGGAIVGHGGRGGAIVGDGGRGGAFVGARRREARFVAGRRHKRPRTQLEGFKFEVQSVWAQMASMHPNHIIKCGSEECHPTLTVHNLTPTGGVGSGFEYEHEDIVHLHPELHYVWPCLLNHSLGTAQNKQFWQVNFWKHGSKSGLSTSKYFQNGLKLYNMCKDWEWKEDKYVTIGKFISQLPFTGTLKLRRLPKLLNKAYKDVELKGVSVPVVWIFDSMKFRVDTDLNFNQNFETAGLKVKEKIVRGEKPRRKKIQLSEKMILPTAGYGIKALISFLKAELRK